MRNEYILERLHGKVLDVGCNEGNLLLMAVKKGIDITGVDININVLNRLKAKGDSEGLILNLECNSIENLKFPEETFDIIVLGEIIEHIKDPFICIKRLMPMLKKDGKFIITTPCGLAHYSQEHINFFFTREQLDVANKLWMLNMFPKLFLDLNDLFILDTTLERTGWKFTLEVKDWQESKHESLDFYIEIFKSEEKLQ